jgi:hypothetical protein
MTTSSLTCACGGEIRPSYIGPAPLVGALAAKGEITFPASCQKCGKTYPDIVSIPMTSDDLAMVRDRLSESTRQDLLATATEISVGTYRVDIAEERARDLAAKAANLGLLTIANTFRQELNSLMLQRRQR